MDYSGLSDSSEDLSKEHNGALRDDNNKPLVPFRCNGKCGQYQIFKICYQNNHLKEVFDSLLK